MSQGDVQQLELPYAPLFIKHVPLPCAEGQEDDDDDIEEEMIEPDEEAQVRIFENAAFFRKFLCLFFAKVGDEEKSVKSVASSIQRQQRAASVRSSQKSMPMAVDDFFLKKMKNF